MTIIDFLLRSDPAVKRMTQVYLQEQPTSYTVDGWISEFLSRFDEDKGTWDNGIYGPKWTSTFYTLRDLRSLEIDPQNSIYQKGLRTLVSNMWNPDVFMEDDLCVVAMLVSLLVYGQFPEPIINEMVQYLINHQSSDGGWNCAVIYSSSTKSSIHTTLSVLEAYADYEKEGYQNNLIMIKEQAKLGQQYLLRKKLLRRESDNEIILPYITQFHFPTRWKYDVLRALSYFASIEYTYDSRMEEGITLLKKRMNKGYLTKGSTYAGRIHFPMETTRIGSMNSLRGLLVLKHYDYEYYCNLICKEISV